MAKGLADWLEEQGEDVIYKEDKITMEEIKELSPDFIISYNYQYIISKEIIDCVGGKAINLHSSFCHGTEVITQISEFLEDTPKGVTIHYIDEGIDTGDIIVQKEVVIDEEKKP